MDLSQKTINDWNLALLLFIVMKFIDHKVKMLSN